MQKKTKRIKIYVILISLLIILGIGGIVYNMKIPTEHEKQVAFLKKHEKEMTEYVKSQNSKIKTVEYDWNSVKVGKIGNGTPQGAGKSLQLFGKFNGLQDSGFRLDFDVKEKGKIEMNTITLGQPFRKRGKIYD